MDCPCQSGTEFSNCCEPILSGKEKAETAERLMRARYTAFTRVDMDFVNKTHDPKTKKDLDPEANRRWAESAEWKGLDVVGTTGGGPEDEKGTVEFKVSYDMGDGPEEHHELSTFVKRNGQWYFSDGKNPSLKTVERGEKVGRNDPCPCGSGKKYKKCCG
ncbi:MAG: YchJ family protein [Bdellovibrionaceae bacterium]|nr:YchJ family protein [Bdellovibrionales bacterium]MCB9086557.1 YchJ family protein [Pseudobdellovibrionaceae bacterium]